MEFVFLEKTLLRWNKKSGLLFVHQGFHVTLNKKH